MTTVADKIRKRIRTLEIAKAETVEEIQITKKEAEQLGETRTIDNVKLIVVDKIGDLSKKDCFAYIDRNGHKSCYCLEKLYCKNKKCNFYRTDITIPKIEKSVEHYVLRK